jgi:hypothetical protein
MILLFLQLFSKLSCGVTEMVHYLFLPAPVLPRLPRPPLNPIMRSWWMGESNAFFALTGKRLRQLPFPPARIQATG